MNINIKYLIVFFVTGLLGVTTLQAQKDTDYGAVLTFEVDRELSRFFRLSFDEEIRLVNNNNYGFERSATTLGLDYELFYGKGRIGAYYSFLYLYNSDYIHEARHRYFLNASYKEDVGSFTLSWRGRFQSTIRNENLGSYKVNPKYVLRNRLQAEYNFFMSRWTPVFSCDLTTALNDPRYDLSRIRFQGGADYRLYRNTYLSAFLRYDVNYEEDENNRLSVGFTYRIKM